VNLNTIEYVSVNLTQLVRTMHNICKVRGLNHKKNLLNIIMCLVFLLLAYTLIAPV